MNASLSWIKAYVPDLDCSYKEFADVMTLTGTKVESFKVFDEDLDKIVVGLITKIEKHPDADKLIVCQVDIGSETVQIVTGADNVFEGAKVPVVLAGGKVAGGHEEGSLVPGGVKIKAGKLRGVISNGMMCSIEELGSTREMYPEAPEYGIYILHDDAKVGTDAIELMGLRDANYEFEITSNRVDCYSILGIAREAAASFGKKFNYSKPVVKNETGDINDYLEVEVKDPDLCPRYMARMVKNIRLAPSPEWLKRRLVSCGIRPINNIVDITNYVMEEYGQPMHAFDYDTILGHKIIVARASDGDDFVTLDGQLRKMDKDVLMINDAERAIGIAGIMGGEDSKITDDVKTMVFESAAFNGINNRLSAKRLGLRTDASGKYEKGLDPENCEAAVNRACELIELLDAGDVIGGAIDIYPNPVKPKEIKFEPERINAYLGIDISAEEMLGYLKPLEIEYNSETEVLTVPTFRQDLLRGCDIAEEVARFYGYAKIPSTLPNTNKVIGGLSKEFVVNKRIRRIMRAYGYSEAVTFSFESPKVFDKLRISDDDPLRLAVKISNPLGEDFSIMRTTLINGLMTSLGVNFSRRIKSAALYELNNIYIPESVPLTALPDERMTLSFGAYGKDYDFYTVKGLLEDLFDELGLKGIREYSADCNFTFLHPGRQAVVTQNRQPIAYLGEVHPLVSKAYGIGGRVYFASADVKALYELSAAEKKYKGIPKYPAVNRDLSLVMKKDILAGDVRFVIARAGGKLMEDIELFDVYEGEQLEEGFKSLAYTLTFRASDRTLNENEIAPLMEKIIKKLSEIGVELRS